MQTHKLCWCCSVMQGYIADGIVTVNVDAGTANLNAINVPTPIDDDLQVPEMTRIPITFCPNCGMVIVTYAENIPTPTYTRAALNGASCNDVTCRYLNTSDMVCNFAYRNNIGCYSIDEPARQAISDLTKNVFIGLDQMVNE